MMHRISVLGWIFLLLSGLAVAQEKVFLAAEDDWYPYSAKSGKEAEGRSVDLVKAAYAAAGATLTLDVVPFKRGLVKTKEGFYAGVFSGGLNDEVIRDFLVPKNFIAVSEQVAVARRGEPFAGLKSFHGKRLVLTNGYTYPAEITSDSRNAIYTAIGEVNSLKMIAAKRADFTIMDRMVFMSLLKKMPELKESLAIAGQLHTENIYVFFARNEAGERAQTLFDKGMDIISRNGVMKKIVDQWDEKLR